MKDIKDKFTDLPISKQRKWQLRQRENDCCEECGKPVYVKEMETFKKQRLCEEHVLKKAGYAKKEK